MMIDRLLKIFGQLFPDKASRGPAERQAYKRAGSGYVFMVLMLVWMIYYHSGEAMGWGSAGITMLCVAGALLISFTSYGSMKRARHVDGIEAQVVSRAMTDGPVTVVRCQHCDRATALLTAHEIRDRMSPEQRERLIDLLRSSDSVTLQ